MRTGVDIKNSCNKITDIKNSCNKIRTNATCCFTKTLDKLANCNYRSSLGKVEEEGPRIITVSEQLKKTQQREILKSIVRQNEMIVKVLTTTGFIVKGK